MVLYKLVIQGRPKKAWIRVLCWKTGPIVEIVIVVFVVKHYQELAEGKGREMFFVLKEICRC